MADGCTPSFEADVPLHAATLRYLDAQGPFAMAAADAAGVPLPAAPGATVVAAGAAAGVLLATLRPTETLALSEAAAPLAVLRDALAGVAGGCVVDLTGGLKVLRLRGARLAELMSRLGGGGTTPRVGEARRGRLADVGVLALGVGKDEILLIVDRAYASHLTTWIEETLADWPAAGTGTASDD
jgi:sarcosine oxidase gamma subunit